MDVAGSPPIDHGALGIDGSKLAAGVAMLVLNLGSKYIVKDLAIDPDVFFNHIVVRRLVIFALFYLATKDLYHSFILTAAFVIIATGLFNPDSRLCIIPRAVEKQDDNL